MTIPANDYDMDAGLSGAQYRAEDNTIIESILTLQASASLPPVTFPFMWRVDQNVTPNELQIRNPSNNAFLKVAEITDSLVSLFSNGAGIPSLGVAQTFTATQTIDKSGVPGELAIGSDLSSGVVARIPMFGHNSIGSNVTGCNLVLRINTNTAGAEAFTVEIEVTRPSGAITVAKLGDLSDFRRTGGSGIVDADTVRQAGVTLAQIVREGKGRFGNGGDFSVGFTPVQSDEGAMYRFNGSSNVVVELATLARNTVVYFQNESPNNSTVTFAAAAVSGITDFRTTRLVLPGISTQAPTCAVHWYLSGGTRVNIIGDNI